MRNRFKGKCFRCNKEVGEGEGFFQKVQKGDGKLREVISGKWAVRCKECVGTGNLIEIE